MVSVGKRHSSGVEIVMVSFLIGAKCQLIPTVGLVQNSTHPVLTRRFNTKTCMNDTF